MARVLCGDDVPVTLSKRAAARLAEARDEHAFLLPDATVVTQVGDRRRWWTFAGGGANAVLAQSLRQTGLGVNGCDDIGITFSGSLPASELGHLPLPDLDDMPVPEGLLSSLKFNDCLPTGTARKIVSARVRDVSGAQAILDIPVVVSG